MVEMARFLHWCARSDVEQGRGGRTVVILLAHISGVPVEELLTPPATGIAAGMLLSLASLMSGLLHQLGRQQRQ